MMRKRGLWQRLRDNLSVISGVLVIAATVALFVLGIIDAIQSIPVLHEGTVVDKTYRAAYTEVVMLSLSDSNGHTTRYPQNFYHPDRWTVQVVGMTTEDERRVEWWEVGEGLFNQVAINDYVYRDTKSGVVTMKRKGVLVDAASGD